MSTSVSNDSYVRCPLILFDSYTLKSFHTRSSVTKMIRNRICKGWSRGQSWMGSWNVCTGFWLEKHTAMRRECAQEVYYTGRQGGKCRGLQITDLLHKSQILWKLSDLQVLWYVRNATWKVETEKTRGAMGKYRTMVDKTGIEKNKTTCGTWRLGNSWIISETA